MAKSNYKLSKKSTIFSGLDFILPNGIELYLFSDSVLWDSEKITPYISVTDTYFQDCPFYKGQSYHPHLSKRQQFQG